MAMPAYARTKSGSRSIARSKNPILLHSLGREPHDQWRPADELIRVQVVGGRLPHARAFVSRQPGLERGGNLQSDVALNREDIGQLAVVGLAQGADQSPRQ